MSPRIALALAAAVVAAALAAPVPVLDEESYLEIAGALDASRPYDWWRPWPPWGGEREADAFVYAHPPLFLLWVQTWVSRAGVGPNVMRALKVAAALPLAGLLGWSVGRLAERLTRRPWLTVGLWLAGPVVVLVLQRGLMPDLMMAAFGALGVSGWLEGRAASRPSLRIGWFIGGGVALAAASWTKYPALLLIPALLLHDRSLRGQRWVFWVAFALPWLSAESWLWALYGRPHLWEVLSRAGEIPRGPLGGRTLGVATRLALLLGPWPLLLRGWRTAWVGALGVAGLLVLVGAPEGAEPQRLVGLLCLATPGVMLVWFALRQSFTSRPGSRGAPDRLLGAWALFALAGVIVGHNYAAPRYLLPVVTPLVLLMSRAFEQRTGGRAVLQVGAALHGLLALALTSAEHELGRASVQIARAAVHAHPEGGQYTGEWTFRWRMRRAGWTFYVGDPPSGGVVVAAEQTGPAELPGDWTVVGRTQSGSGGLRVVDAANGVSLYSETMGAMPIGWGDGPVAEAIRWRVP